MYLTAKPTINGWFPVGPNSNQKSMLELMSVGVNIVAGRKNPGLSREITQTCNKLGMTETKFTSNAEIAQNIGLFIDCIFSMDTSCPASVFYEVDGKTTLIAGGSHVRRDNCFYCGYRGCTGADVPSGMVKVVNNGTDYSVYAKRYKI
jgi:hypothetical protein